ncbi:MAG: hypothetical protein ABI333_21835 [bacterium]
MSRFKTLVALVLVFLFVPGTLEATENLLHLVTHGDLAHQVPHADHHEPGGEHDCSGLFHSCVCHSSILVTVSDLGGAVAAPPPHVGRHLIHVSDRTTSGFPDRLYRPPIA